MINFSPTCTLPTEAMGFVQGPNIRGTMEIVWSCLSIIILCTWSILHLKVPPQHKPKTWRQRIRWRLALFRQKLKWMFLTIMAPEYLLGLAFANFRAAWGNTTRLQKLADRDGVPWSLTHSFFANQGGFLLHSPPELDQPVETAVGTEDEPTNEPPSRCDEIPPAHAPAENRTKPSTEPNLQLSETDGAGIELGGSGVSWGPGSAPSWDLRKNSLLWERWKKHIRRRNEAVRKYGDLQPKLSAVFRRYGQEEEAKVDDVEAADKVIYHIYDTWALDSIQLAYARERGIIGALPDLHEDDINDRNKGDAIVKFLAVLQAGWMVTQLAVRAIRGLPSAAIEIMTVAFAACSLVTYLLQWSNVKDVAVPVRLVASRLPTKEEFNQFVKFYDAYFAWSGRDSNPSLSNNAVHYRAKAVMKSSETTGLEITFISCCGSLLFGGIHLAAWNFAFPTPLEQGFWRASALVLAFSPIISSLIAYLGFTFQDRAQASVWENILVAMALFGLVLYVVARFFLLVDCFRSLYFLPPAAYQATWTKNAPHLG